MSIEYSREKLRGTSITIWLGVKHFYPLDAPWRSGEYTSSPYFQFSRALDSDSSSEFKRAQILLLAALLRSSCQVLSGDRSLQTLSPPRAANHWGLKSEELQFRSKGTNGFGSCKLRLFVAGPDCLCSDELRRARPAGGKKRWHSRLDSWRMGTAASDGG